MVQHKGYFDIACALERFSDSPRAAAYLDEIIEFTCPDSFHWTDYEEAQRLMVLDEQEGKLLP